jgi:hypothetical protein
MWGAFQVRELRGMTYKSGAPIAIRTNSCENPTFISIARLSTDFDLVQLCHSVEELEDGDVFKAVKKR